MIDLIRKRIQRDGLIAQGDLLIVAVSGGPDSLALLYVLHALRDELGIQLHVAHLNHQLRPEAADEASFVAEQAALLGIPISVESIDVGALAKSTGTNLYAAGRYARYTMFARLAEQIGATAVAVGHTANDQAETVLLHLLRGAGPEGLAAMRSATPWSEWGRSGVRGQGLGIRSDEHIDKSIAYQEKHIPFFDMLKCDPYLQSPSLVTGEGLGVRARLIRPLLDITREQIEAFCAAQSLIPRRDPANDDISHTRSRIRQKLIPELIEYNPHIVQALCRTATICADEQAMLLSQLDSCWSQLTTIEGQGISFLGQRWRELPTALQRLAVRRAYALLIGDDRALDFEHVEELRASVTKGVGHRMILPGALALEVGYAGNFTLGQPAAQQAPQLMQEAVLLRPPWILELGSWRCTGTVEQIAQAAANQWELWLDLRTFDPESLIMRRRQPGDRIRPAGGKGSRSLQNLMVDRKIAQSVRSTWPILVAGQQIVWVPGIRAAEGVSCMPGEGPALWIRLEMLNAEC